MAQREAADATLFRAGRGLKIWRRQRGLSQAEFGAYVGYSRVAIGYWEQGRSRMPLRLIQIAIHHYDCPATIRGLDEQIVHLQMRIASEIEARNALRKHADQEMDDLRAERARLRGALERIVDPEYGDWDVHSVQSFVRDVLA